ncbi:MAG TPA: protein kinase [Gemmatimonadales bacterium]|jgi:serine/threonine-protein kinase|nr:protein kinase [Gemmatimonadales bacterium]
MTTVTTPRSCPACKTPLPEEAQFCLRCGLATPTDPGVPPRTAVTGVVEVSKVKKALASRYKVERVLGEGGMATVYLAQDLKYHRSVAVKVMRPELASTLGADRFLREVEIAAKLTHPHILPMYESGEVDGLLYYVMPYAEGETLRERIHRETQLPVEDALKIAREVAEALAYAHERGIIHRDIKPANILLGGGHAMVADFGIARAVTTTSNDPLTQTGLAVGTPHYMAPEQAMGDREVDARADIYAVGALLYEMLAGEPPFTGPTPRAIVTRSMTEAPRSLITSRAELLPEVDRVALKALAKSPADRFATATALAAALDQALDVTHSGARPAVESSAPAPLQVLGLFIIVGIMMLTMAYALVQKVGLPQWMFLLAIGLMLAGLPIMLLGAKNGPGRTGIRRFLSLKNGLVGGVLAFTAWGVLATVLVLKSPASAAAASQGSRLAVLPFTNRGAPEDAYLADGIADEVRGKLAGLGTFQLIARSSSDQYRESTKSPQEIGRELDVKYLLTATVRWARAADGTSRVQVVPELIDARTGDVTWQQSYDANLTDVFQVQTEIAGRVAGALGVALGSQQETQLAERPTDNLAAYDLYLKGRASPGRNPASLRRAIGYYEQAVALDSSFSEAWSQLSRSLSILYSNSSASADLDRQSRHAAEQALRSDPKGPQGHAAMAQYYSFILSDNTEAQRHIQEALRLAPDNPEYLTMAAQIERASGRFEEAVAHLQVAFRLDPRSGVIALQLQRTYLWLRRYPEAMTTSEAALARAPGELLSWQYKAMVYVAQGDLAGAREVIRQASPAVAAPELAANVANYWDMYWVLDEPEQQMLFRLTPAAFDNDRTVWATVLMQLAWLRGDRARARVYADTAWQGYQAKLRDTPNDAQQHVMGALALAYLGRKNEAIALGLKGLELVPISKDEFGAYYQHLMARVYLLVGEPEKALDMLEPLLQMPYYLSPGWLRVDPTFAELKGNPRYDRLVQP